MQQVQVQLKFVNDETLKFKTTNDEFENEIKDCRLQNTTLKQWTTLKKWY